MLRRLLCLVAALAVAAVLAGCGAAGEANPQKIGPRGVDELVIPTPSPDAGDFVRKVDNPWLPLAPGTVWTYDVTGGGVRSLQVRVEADRRTIAGVSCVVVSWTTTDRRHAPVGEGRTYYAQDRRGNVWLFGQDNTVTQTTRGPASPSWHAGEGGAEAGIAMLAEPRVGDGYLHELSGNTADRATILSVDEERAVPAGTFSGLVLTEDESVLPQDQRVVRRYYAQGVGLVEQTTTAGGTERALLVSVATP